MMPLKQQAPIGGLGQAAMEYGKHESSGVAQFQQGVCIGCAFYEVITRKRGHVHGLCHFTGMRNPLPGQDGCFFLAGKWDAIDEILGLTQGKSINNLDFPNKDRPSDCLCHAPHGENNGISALNSHFQCHNWHEYKLAATRPVSVRTGGLSLAGERVPPFVFKKSLNKEVCHEELI